MNAFEPKFTLIIQFLQM